MTVLGICGGVAALEMSPEFHMLDLSHDAGAAIVSDGRLLAAIEQERLDRVKHSFVFPEAAIRAAIQEANISASSIKYIAIPFSEAFLEGAFRAAYHLRPELSSRETPRELYCRLLANAGLSDFNADQLRFIPHHRAHIEYASYLSGQVDSIVFAADGRGEMLSGMIARITSGGTEILRELSLDHSLGAFFHAVTEHLGFRTFDEFKVMGLAAYGRSGTVQREFTATYATGPEGRFSISPNLAKILWRICPPRRAGTAIQEIHMDLAYAAQQALEHMTLHALAWFRDTTGSPTLCMCGGVAQNCALAGAVARSGLFDLVFVPPAAHDGGNASGAALAVAKTLGPLVPPYSRVHLGRGLQPSEELGRSLDGWRDVLEYTTTNDIAYDAASALGQGQIIGWVHGRAEHGPRALGARSILADPRSRKARDRINLEIKEREDFRPLAPSVIAEDAHLFFGTFASKANLDCMGFAAPVLKNAQQFLKAVTHADGTARVQIVGASDDPLFFSLLVRWKEVSGLGVLLNTSFNGSSEPIVDSCYDAIRAFLTMPLDTLFMGDYVVRKRPVDMQTCIGAHPISLTRTARIMEETRIEQGGSVVSHRFVLPSYSVPGERKPFMPELPVSGATVAVLKLAETKSPLIILMGLLGLSSTEEADCCSQIIGLWKRRFIDILPLEIEGQ